MLEHLIVHTTCDPQLSAQKVSPVPDLALFCGEREQGGDPPSCDVNRIQNPGLSYPRRILKNSSERVGVMSGNLEESLQNLLGFIAELH